jgi:O-antigen/teichoic acid export membrane protein
MALYSVPLTILQYSMILPAIVATAFFPLLAELLRTAPAAAKESFELLLRIFALVSVPIALVLSVAGEPVLTLLFGSRYRDAAGPLAILAWSVVLGFLNYLFWYCLLAAYKEGAKFRIMLVGLALNIALNVALIPPYGPRGAAIALLASDLLVVAWQGLLVHRHLFSFELRSFLLKPVVAGAGAVLVLLATLGLSRWLAAPAAAVTYTALLLALRYVSWEEWQPLVVPARSLLRRALGART